MEIARIPHSLLRQSPEKKVVRDALMSWNISE